MTGASTSPASCSARSGSARSSGRSSRGRRTGSEARVVLGFVLAALALVGFVLVEWRSAHPMMPLSLFRIRELSVANIATFFIYAALGSALFFLVLFAQSVLGYSPAKAGLIVVPISISLLLLAARFGRAADRIGPRPFLIGGPVLIGIGLALLGRLDAGSSYWVDVFPPLVVFSVGLSATVPAVTSTALKPAPEGLTGVASGINTTVSRVGQLVAVAGLGVVVSLVYSSTGRAVLARVEDAGRARERRGCVSRRDVGSRRARVRRRARQRARSSSAAERAKRSDRARSRQRLSACSRVAPCSVKIASRKLAVSLCPCSESRSPGRTSSSSPGSASGTASTKRVLEHAHDIGDRNAVRRAGRPRGILADGEREQRVVRRASVNRFDERGELGGDARVDLDRVDVARLGNEELDVEEAGVEPVSRDEPLGEGVQLCETLGPSATGTRSARTSSSPRTFASQ